MNEEQLRAELDAVYASASWKMTAPFRWLAHFLKRIILSLISPEKTMGRLKKILGRILRKIFKQTLLRRACMAIVSRFPSMRERLKIIMLTSEFNQSQIDNLKKMHSQSNWLQQEVQLNQQSLTLEAQKILREFQSLAQKK